MENKQLIRTYQRKPFMQKPFVSLVPLPVRMIEKYDSVENAQKCSDKNGTFNESLNYDPFETTFDKLAKEVVIPPLPLDINQNDSWNGNSSDSDMISIKSSKHDEFTRFTCNSISDLSHRSIKLARKCKKPRKYELNAITSKETLSKKKKTVSKTEAQLKKTKTQKQKNQISRVRKRKKITQNKSKASNIYNEQQSCSKFDISNLKNVMRKNVSCNDNIKHLHKKILRTNETTMLQNTLDDFVADLKYMSNHFKNIKPCFVKLDDCIQNYVVNAEKSVVDKPNELFNTKFLQTNKDISEEVHNITSQSISTEYNNVITNFKNISLKSCSVMLCDNTVGNRSEKYINSCLDICDSSKTISCCNDNVKFAICAEKNSENIVKDSFVRVERLKIEEFVKKDNVSFNKKKRYIVSSTPNDKRIKPSYSILFSPIDTKNTSHLEQNCSMMIEKDVFNVSSDKYPNKKIRLSITHSEDHEIDAADIQKQQMQLSLSSQNTRINEDFIIKSKISFEENSHTALVQEYEMEHDTKMVFPRSLNIFANHDHHDQSRSLFGDTTIYSNHSTQDITKNEIKEKIDEMAYMTFQNASNMIYEQNDKNQGDIMAASLKDLRKEIIGNKHNSHHNQDDNNIVNIDILTQLQDSTKITTRKIQYTNLNMQNIAENSNHENIQLNNKIFHCIANNENPNFHKELEVSQLECLKDTSLNTPFYQFESFNLNQQYNDNANRQIEKCLFLKPGKSWTRSLSILNNINDECNLDKLSIGKGKKWRSSVKDLLDMQKQGSNTSSFDVNKRKTLNFTDHIRFSKRNSVRVVLNNTDAKQDVKDTPFLEAFGILAENSKSKLSDQTQIAKQDFIKKRSTAKDVVLKKCLQQYYLSFSECFPDSYLEHCRKIGEGVYGEVFLYDYDNKKSVIKIIPIEGKELINGEPQKKFNEILSEIVIAKELDNLKLNDTYRTTGFIEVKSIKCIIGRYPEKLVKLWNIYDEAKTSDNDCPLIFGENQLYIVFELGHGGEDLEAFVFQTAEETYSLFLQIVLALAVAEKAFEFEHRDLHWGNVLISRTKDKYIYYNLDGKEIKITSKGVKVSIIDFTLSRMLYQECCIYNDLALDPALFTAHGEYQFEIYRLMRDKIQ